MEEQTFSAFALAGELDLNRLGAGLGIARKFRWEEPLILDPVTLRVPPAEGTGGQRVYLYAFGGVVFLNCADPVIRGFAAALEKIIPAFRGFPNLKYQEQYLLRIDEKEKPAITNDWAVVNRHEPVFTDIIAFVVAKSVALERIEERVDQVFDDTEGVIALLDRGKLDIRDKTLAKLASSILTFKYRSIAYVMVLEKPEITWENLAADRFYLTMANLFELNQRYDEIRHKSETLMDITSVFSDLSHARRASRLEIIIIVLIAIEIVLYLFKIGG